VPISGTNREAGITKLKIREMGSRYLFIILYLWLEKILARGDYHRRNYGLPDSGQADSGLPDSGEAAEEKTAHA